MNNLTEMEQAYIECMLWSSTDPEGEPLYDRFDIRHLSEGAIKRVKRDCDAFVEKAGALLDELSERFDADDLDIGHDFWLTRNGLGTGFWDRGYGDLGDRLSSVAESFGDCWTLCGHETVDLV